MSCAFGQSLPTIAKIPDLPPDYLLRDWDKTAHEFDKLVFDRNRTGEFLPLIWEDEAKIVNDVNGFGLPTYVGDSRQSSETNIHEAITSMASVLNGILLGNDRSTHAAMLSAHFDRKNGIGLYLNQPGSTGGSFWYDLFPAFYSLRFTNITPRSRDTGNNFCQRFINGLRSPINWVKTLITPVMISVKRNP